MSNYVAAERWLLYGEFVNDFLHKQYKMKRIFYVDEVRDLIHQ